MVGTGPEMAQKTIDYGRRIAVRGEHTSVPLAGDLAVDAHRADEDEPLHAAGVHRSDEALGLLIHRAGEVCVDYVVALHGHLDGFPVEHVAFDDPDTRRIGVGQPTGAAQGERELRIGVSKEHARRVARELPVRAEDEDRGAHLPTRAARCAG